MIVGEFINKLQNIKDKNTRLICLDSNFVLGVDNVVCCGKVILLKTSHWHKNILSVRQLASKLIDLDVNNDLILLDLYETAHIINNLNETSFGWTIINYSY